MTRLRDGSVADLAAVLGLLDHAVEWLGAQGRTGQWGDQPWSASEARVGRIDGMIERPNARLVAEDDAGPVAALAHGPEAHAYVPPADGPEDYVLLLVSDPAARGAGRLLLDDPGRGGAGVVSRAAPAGGRRRTGALRW